jgi:hypothetical protein
METTELDPGRGYVRGYRLSRKDNDVRAVQLAQRFYGDRFVAAMTRALHLSNVGRYFLSDEDRPHQRLGCVLALLHRLLEETSAELDDVRQAGFDEEIVALLDAASARPGETAKQTALRAVANPTLVLWLCGLSTSTALTIRPRTAGEWWPTDPDAWDVLYAERERLDEQATAQRKETRFEYGLPGEALEAVGVPPAWANALYDTFAAFTDPEFFPAAGRRAVHYSARRVRRLNADRHLVEVFESGMTPDEYNAFVCDTSLTWTQIPKWYRLGVTIAQANAGERLFGASADTFKEAITLAGSPARAISLARWSLHTVSSEDSETEPSLTRTLRWYRNRSDNQLDSLTRVRDAWRFLRAHQSDEEARRLLDLIALVPLPPAASWGRRSRSFSDDHAHLAAITAWNETGLTIERIALFLAAEITDPKQASSPETQLLTDEQLRLAASMNRTTAR